ncbi:MAG TPA: hypothetical protein VI959_04545, partial [Alphaproteobacteria bacterium]|nr:hypothetical protein [Alphaproteobacteria bacterium]
MTRPKIKLNDQKAPSIYQYFSKALYEKRIFKDDKISLNVAQESFEKIPLEPDDQFKIALKNWLDRFVSKKNWQRCLATLRQIQANKKNEIKSIKISKETYDLVKNYADTLGLSIDKALKKAMESQVLEAKGDVLKENIFISLKEEVAPKTEKTIQVKLNLYVENNSKFVRGKKKAKEYIDDFLSDYQAKKLKNDEGSYILTIIYDDEEDLEKTISDIYSEISFLADLRNC